jgi:hypothetical protein
MFADELVNVFGYVTLESCSGMPEGGAIVDTGIGTELGEAPEAFTALTLYRYSVLGERLLTMSDVPNGIGLFV